MFKSTLLKKTLIMGGGCATVTGTCAGGIYFDQISNFVVEQLGYKKITPSKFDVEKLRQEPFITFFTASVKENGEVFSDENLDKPIKCKYTYTSGQSEITDDKCVMVKLSMYDTRSKDNVDTDYYYYKFKVSSEIFKSFSGKTNLDNFDPDSLDIFDEKGFTNSKELKIEFTDSSSTTKTADFTINNFDFYKTSDLPSKQTNQLN